MCHQQLENYQQSTDYCQKIVDDHPDYRLADNALFTVGHNYEKLKESGALSESVKGGVKSRRVAGRNKTAALPGNFCENNVFSLLCRQ